MPTMHPMPMMKRFSKDLVGLVAKPNVSHFLLFVISFYIQSTSPFLVTPKAANVKEEALVISDSEPTGKAKTKTVGFVILWLFAISNFAFLRVLPRRQITLRSLMGTSNVMWK